MIGPVRTGPLCAAVLLATLATLLPKSLQAAPQGVALSTSMAARAEAVSEYVPVFQPLEPMNVDPGQVVEQTIHATDPDGDPLTFSKLDGPAYMTVTTVDAGSGTATGTIRLAPPPGTPFGPTSGTVSVSDGVHRGQGTVRIVVSTNVPFMDPLQDMTLAEGEWAEQVLSADDIDLDPLSFFMVSGPSFATVTMSVFSPGQWALRLDPGLTDEGVYPVVVAVTDGTATDSKSLTVTVTHTNAAPVLEQPADMTVNAGETADQVVRATDLDGEPLTFARAGGPGFVTMTTTNPGSGSATGNIHVAPTIADATTPSESQRYDVLAQVGDGALANSKFFHVTVNYPPDHPPQFEQLEDLTVAQGTTGTLFLRASDPDGDGVSFFKLGGPEFVRVIPTPSGWVVQAQPSFADSGSYLVIVQARDFRGATDEKSFHVIVTDGDEPPHVEYLTNMLGFPGHVTVQDFHAYDPEGNALTFSKSQGPSFMTVETVNAGPTGATGRVRIAPTATDVRLWAAGVLVSDGTVSTSRYFPIDVRPLNVPVLSPVADMCLSSAESLTVVLHAVDPEGDRLVYRQTGLPGFAALVDSGDGNAALVIHPSQGGEPGGSFVTITVSDGTYEATDLFTLRLGTSWDCGRGWGDPWLGGGGNASPWARVGGPYTGIAGVPVSFDGSQSYDPDATPIELAWSFGDGAVALGPAPTHTYSWGGLYTVRLVVSDGYLAGGTFTTATIADAFVARAFTAVGQSRVRLYSGKPDLTASIEPVNGSFQLSDVDPSTLVMTSSGTGTVDRIAAAERKGSTLEDTDGNGIEELRVAFAREDLQRLLDTASGVVTVRLEGSLRTGGIFRGELSLVIIPAPPAGASSVWPNPLNPSGTLRFTTAVAGEVTIRLFDLSGRLVRTLLPRQKLDAGEHTVRIDGRDSRGSPLATGVYFYRIEAPGGTSQGRFVVAK